MIPDGRSLLNLKQVYLECISSAPNVDAKLQEAAHSRKSAPYVFSYGTPVIFSVDTHAVENPLVDTATILRLGQIDYKCEDMSFDLHKQYLLAFEFNPLEQLKLGVHWFKP